MSCIDYIIDFINFEIFKSVFQRMLDMKLPVCEYIKWLSLLWRYQLSHHTLVKKVWYVWHWQNWHKRVRQIFLQIFQSSLLETTGGKEDLL